eukprot:CAMPEP_0119108376 /NCGR_PEP_ID=MMETSP1180-20130426/13999_1 /TAXON_ID=3052 ORGANISM="Chlamydomonas cf sp, Strain CCMP681" /NCGR_SAMPLE_ID=MMETSP1180 /ASSEMBLY_ACC=CAM_ASM_000741 /LENGTH=223 /DNA_ID=CAMNT_0007093981 /DNA_START=81 /DNA_END=752 /DNA_ORIENTATION=+
MAMPVHKSARSCAIQQLHVGRTHRITTCAVTRLSRSHAVSEPARRTALLSLFLTPMLFSSQQAQAITLTSSLCIDAKSEEEDKACRLKNLALDAVTDSQAAYGAVTKAEFKLAPGVPSAILDDEYTIATLRLVNELESYCTLDIYDKARIPLIKSMKGDINTWVGKYARGGSARSQSARRMYIAVDSVAGHMASNGLAPLPAPKVKSVLKSVGEAKEFLAKNI